MGSTIEKKVRELREWTRIIELVQNRVAFVAVKNAFKLSRRVYAEASPKGLTKKLAYWVKRGIQNPSASTEGRHTPL